jgi:hypothetical protein
MCILEVIMMLNTEKVKFKVSSAIGKIFVGDVYFALDPRVYDGVWGDLYGYKDGEWKDPDSGFLFAMKSTVEGDGIFLDSNGKSYEVESGTLGVVPVELWKGEVDEEYLDQVGMVVHAGEIEMVVDLNGTFAFLFNNCSMLVKTEV